VSTSDRTVVVTGVGATTPLGGDAASTWEGMLAGRSGVRLLAHPWAERTAVRIAAEAAVEPADAASGPLPPDRALTSSPASPRRM
jgi:3-oxoacyl-[acyl-carrier-protein] synthase II